MNAFEEHQEVEVQCYRFTQSKGIGSTFSLNGGGTRKLPNIRQSRSLEASKF
jgi:hypothetical protein